MNQVILRHNFETAHRLPHLAGKCQSLHGHSWWVEVTVAGPVDRGGVVVEFGAAKAVLRNWVDTHLDHGSMLGVGDPLLAALESAGCKVFRFGAQSRDGAEALAADLHWPTVENVATLLGRAYIALAAALDPGLSVTRVRVAETHVNAAEWCP